MTSTNKLIVTYQNDCVAVWTWAIWCFSCGCLHLPVKSAPLLKKIKGKSQFLTYFVFSCYTFRTHTEVQQSVSFSRKLKPNTGLKTDSWKYCILESCYFSGISNCWVSPVITHAIKLCCWGAVFWFLYVVNFVNYDKKYPHHQTYLEDRDVISKQIETLT